MLKKAVLGVVVVLLAAIVFVVVKWVYPLQSTAEKYSAEAVARDYLLQDDSKFSLPKASAATQHPTANSDVNLYWGELHLHTAESFDASLFGNSLSIEDAYRFAKGEPLTSAGGEVMRLSRPLDFVAITDHAEGFGTRSHCDNPNLSMSERLACWAANQQNPMIFQMLAASARGTAGQGDVSKPPGVYQPEKHRPLEPGAFPTCRVGDGALERCVDNALTDWARYVDLADQFYEPGRLTTLIGYEFSPGLPDQGKHHRNVIFRSNTVPERALSSFDVPNAIGLWKGLEATCVDDCDFLTIPHNPNKAWGLMYSRFTRDAKEYTEADWRLRQKREPLVEIFQVKGAQECALGVGSTDEECGFEQVFEACAPGQLTGCAFATGFVRQGLKVGLELEREFGFNPLQSGFIAATDSHNSNPGDVEEWDFPGAVGAVTSPAIRRVTELAEIPAYQSRLRFHNPGGLAAVWAPENNREAIFDALARRETYATSGPRMALRFYASWDEGPAAEQSDVKSVSAARVPMGGVLRPSTANVESPSFTVWATRDPMDAPLQRLQMVKGWVDVAGEPHEKVMDIACADGLAVDPHTGRCPDNGATVNLQTCDVSDGSGANELKTTWRDPDYEPTQSAFYYVRVLMNPACRWSTFDAVRLGREPDPRVPAAVRERAWSSPIWLRPAS